MRILVIIVTAEMHISLRENIQILHDYLKGEHQVDYAGLSTQDDFKNYEDMIQFKFKMTNPALQLTKLRNFFEAYHEYMNYDWYIKFRPEVKLLQPLDFTNCVKGAINARTREYIGPKKIQYGCSVGDPNGEWIIYNADAVKYDEEEKNLLLDDQIFIFDTTLLTTNFYRGEYSDELKKYVKYEDRIYILPERQDEQYHRRFWNAKSIQMNPIGINMIFMRPNGGLQTRSANVNM
jgi:hypothetical protein